MTSSVLGLAQLPCTNGHISRCTGRALPVVMCPILVIVHWKDTRHVYYRHNWAHFFHSSRSVARLEGCLQSATTHYPSYNYFVPFPEKSGYEKHECVRVVLLVSYSNYGKNVAFRVNSHFFGKPPNSISLASLFSRVFFLIFCTIWSKQS